MAKLSIGQKAERVLHFLMGLRHDPIAANLAAHGFGNEDLAQGWALLGSLSNGRLDGLVVQDPEVVVKVDTWENRWYPIIDATLAFGFPQVHDYVFRNLNQTEGEEVLIAVGILLARLDEIMTPPASNAPEEVLALAKDQKDVKALLARRGITEKVLQEAKDLISSSQRVSKPSPPRVSPEDAAQRETKLWAWYLQWSKIARAVITDRRQLKALGFLDDSGKPTKDEPDTTVQQPQTPTGTTTTTPVVTKPQLDPGMPGASPFTA
jgi:ribosomal protein L7/L12